MEQHAIPREVISFSFKLIGPMTLKQFGYLALAAPCAYIIFMLFPIPYLNALLALAMFGVGAAFAFYTINGRPLEVFVKNLFIRLTTPSQYLYKKEETPLKILGGLYFDADPHVVLAHADSKEKLAAYLAAQSTPAGEDPAHPRADQVKTLLQSPVGVKVSTTSQAHTPSRQASAPTSTNALTQVTKPVPPAQAQTPTLSHPFISGTVTNRKRIPLPGILIYIKDPITSKTLRILKSNPHGVFASFHPLQVGQFVVEITDSAKNYIFDPATITVSPEATMNVYSFVSKEMI